MQSSPISGQVQKLTAMSGAQRRANAKINQMHWADWEGKGNQFCSASSGSSPPGSAQRGLFSGRVRSVHAGRRRRTPPCYTSKASHTHTEEHGRVKKADEKTNTALCSGSAEVLIRERSEARGRREPPAVAAPSDALSRDLGH